MLFLTVYLKFFRYLGPLTCISNDEFEQLDLYQHQSKSICISENLNHNAMHVGNHELRMVSIHKKDGLN